MSAAAGTTAIGEAASGPRPAFMVGITGTRHLDFASTPEAVRSSAEAALKLVFRWLTGTGWPDHNPADDPELTAAVEALGESPRLTHTPLHLYSPLAPGADQLAAQVAEDFNCELFVPLPFDRESYLTSSTFGDENGNLLKEAQQFAATRLERLESEGRAFPVRLADDASLGPDEFRERLQADSNDTARRRLRYRAVGEYVAAHTHLLIALTGDPVTEAPVGDAFPPPLLESNLAAGAGAIIEAKRRGLTPGLLDRSAKVSWADLGPVIHIHTPIGDAPRNGQLPGASISMLFPYDAKPPGAIGALDPAWQQSGRDTFLRSTAMLEQFNASATINEGQQSSETERMTGEVLELPEVDRSVPGDASERQQEITLLDQLAGVRRGAAELSRARDRESTRVFAILFVLAFGGTGLLHLGWHWHLHNEKQSSHTGQELTPQQKLGIDEVSGVTRTMVRLGLVCLLTAYPFYWWFKWTGQEQQRHDTRALAEGLRVQFYWAFVGIGRSVPANYMDRQRSELGWIRQAIRSLAAPYYRFTMWFLKLDPRTQLQRLRSVHEKWIDAQRDYYDSESTWRNHRMHVHHHVGFGMAAASVGHVAFISAVLILPGTFDWAVESTAALIIASLAIVSVPIVGCLAHRRGPALQPQNQSGWWWLRDLRLGCEWCCERFFLLPFPKRIREPAGYAGLALVAPLVSYLFCAGLSDPTASGIPNFLDLFLLATAMFALVGAAYVAWAEKRLHAEHARQYHEMASLFHAASRRLQGHLAAAEHALDAEDVGRFDDHREAMQQLLYDVGLQVLNENAEWLILHRARPLEPVLAG